MRCPRCEHRFTVVLEPDPPVVEPAAPPPRRPKKRKSRQQAVPAVNWPLYALAGGVGLAVVVGLVVFVLGRGGPGPGPAVGVGQQLVAVLSTESEPLSARIN